MRWTDYTRLTTSALRTQRLRSALTALGIGVGIAAVVVLTSIGEGVQRYVVAEFTQFGTNLIAVTPGRNTTFGVSGAVIRFGESPQRGDACFGVDRADGIVPGPLVELGYQALVLADGCAAVEQGERAVAVLCDRADPLGRILDSERGVPPTAFDQP